MEPTFAQDQRVHVRRIASGAPLARGDVIVFRQPGDPAKKYMKRIVGLAGDHIEIAADTLWINGEVQHETYVQCTRPVPRFGPRIVPPETVFVLGDNRIHSFDSRNFGCVPRDHIVGLVTR